MDLQIYIDNNLIVSNIYNDSYLNEKIVIFCHGFPGLNKLSKLKTIQNAALVEINYRGDKLSQGKFSFLNSIEDIREVSRHLRNSYPSAQIFCLGYDMGGLYVSMLAIDHPRLFDRIILVNPVLSSEFLSLSPLMPELWKEARDHIDVEDLEFYNFEIQEMIKSYNPVNNIEDISTATEIVQSSDDEVLNVKLVKAFFETLRCPKKFRWIDGGKHKVEGNEREILEALM